MTRLVPVLLFGIVSSAIVGESWRTQEWRAQLIAARTHAGYVAPAYEGMTVAGVPWRLTEMRGDVVLINVWRRDCQTCVDQFPVLARLHERHQAAGLRVVGINLDRAATSAIQQYVADQRVDYPVVHDPVGRVVLEFGWVSVPASLAWATSVPRSVLISRTGEVVRYWDGGIVPGSPAEKDLQREVRRLLSASST